MSDRFKRIAPLSGVITVALMVVALSLPSTPDSAASGAKVLAFYRDHHTSVYLSAMLIAYAGVIGLLYFTSVASYLRRFGSDVLATLTVVGAALFAAGCLTAAGAVAAANDGPKHFSADMARTLNVLQNDLFFPMVLGGLGVATLCMGVAMLRTHALPKALGIVTTVVGVVGVSGIFSWFAFMASGPLTLVIAAYVYQRLGRPATVTLPEVPGQRAAAMETEAKATTHS
jgi:hypothetical protein